MTALTAVFRLPQQDVKLKYHSKGFAYIDGSCLDHEAVLEKLSLWKELLDANILECEDDSIRKAAWRTVNDDSTLYFYTFFKDPNSGKPISLTAYQDYIASLKHDFSPDGENRYVLFRASNQIGKSMLLQLMAIERVLKDDNVNVVMVSKTLPQSQHLLASIKHLLNNSFFADSWREDLGDQANTTILTFARKVGNQNVVSRIICAPAGEGLLGYPVHYLYLDEADFYEEGKKFFYKVAHPRTKATKGQVVLFSNPNTDVARSESLLWELWTGSLFNNKCHFNFLDAPWNTEAEFEKDRANTPNHIFQSTHLGNFPDEAGSFLSQQEIADMLQKDWSNHTLPAVDRRVYIGLDIGKMNDNSVLCVGYLKTPHNKLHKFDDLDVKYVQVFPLRTDYDVVANRLSEVVEYYESEYYGVAGVGVDSTGQKTFNDLLNSAAIHHTPVDFSSRKSNKTKLYNDFKLFAEQRKIRIVHTPDVEKQLSGLSFKLTPTKKLSVANRSDRIHDDIPDAIAILLHVAIRFGGGKIGGGIAVPKPKQLNSTGASTDSYMADVVQENNQAAINKRMDPYGGLF